MVNQRWFDVPVIGEMPPDQTAAMLREVGEDEIAEALEEEIREQASQTFFPGRSQKKLSPQPWQHTGHAFGYLPPAQVGSPSSLSIQSVEDIQPEPTLKQARLKITLDRLRVLSYPGGGMHQVLVHFSAQNQIPENTEDLHFNATYRVQEGEHAGIRGYPIFLGLNVGNDGIRLKVRTVNVQNEQDEALLKILRGNVFKSGLQLLKTAQPALAPLSDLAFGLTEMILTRNKNIAIQDVDLGLDFSTLRMRPHLAEGSYLAVQMPESEEPAWDWGSWVYQPASGLVVKRENDQQPLPYNYLVFSISRYEGS